MASKRTAAPIKITKTHSAPRASSPPASPIAVNFSPVDLLPELASSFDPHLLLTKLSVGKSTQAYLAGESVYSQGDAADAVFYIQNGRVKLTVVSKSGKEAVVAILPAGSFFGEGCLAGQPLRMATASIDQKSTIVRVERRAMVATLHEEPEFAERFLAYLLTRNVRMESDLVDHLFNSSEKRIARFSTLTIVLFWSALAVAMRSGCPAKQPSPKKLPSGRMPTTASLPVFDTTVSFTLPLWM